MSNVNDIKSKLALLGLDIEEALKEAYDKGYLDGISTEKPTQDEFNNSHATIVPYGDDQDLLILAGNVDYKDAEKAYRRYLKDELGWDDEEIGETDDHMKKSNVSYELYEGEPTFYVRSDRGGIYDCWLWEVEV